MTLKRPLSGRTQSRVSKKLESLSLLRIVSSAYLRSRSTQWLVTLLKIPRGAITLIPIQLLLSIISIPSGALLVYSPGGESIGAQVILPYLRERVPFLQNFAPVGVFLVIVYGLIPMILAYGLWSQKKWAWYLTLLLGITEITWIGAEVTIFYDLGFFFFYPIIAGMGAITVLLCLLPSVRNFYLGARIAPERKNESIFRQNVT
jgi:hypothetical protein